MLHKEFNNGLRAYPIHQAVQAMGSTAIFHLNLNLEQPLELFDVIAVSIAKMTKSLISYDIPQLNVIL